MDGPRGGCFAWRGKYARYRTGRLTGDTRRLARVWRPAAPGEYLRMSVKGTVLVGARTIDVIGLVCVVFTVSVCRVVVAGN